MSSITAAFLAKRKGGSQTYGNLALRLAVLLIVSAGTSYAQVSIPNTPAGRTLRAWLDAFNSGDRAKMQDYITQFHRKESVDGMMAFHNQTGGFELLRVESSQPRSIRFRVKEKASSTIAIGDIRLSAAEPATIEAFGLHAIPPGAIVEKVKSRRSCVRR